MDDDYYENFFNDELYQALTIKSDTLISIDIEMYDILVQIFSNTQNIFLIHKKILIRDFLF